MKTIPLSKGQVALVDDADLEWLSKWKWHATKWKYGFYAQRNGGRMMHQHILPALAGFEIDHIDQNTLNNQRANLRLCTLSENHGNRRKPCNNTSGFKGVCWHKGTERWEAKIGDGAKGKNKHLGQFDSPIEAAKAYDAAAIQRWGQFAKTNASMGLFHV